MSDVQHVRTPKSRCPHCGYLTDTVSTIAGRVPRPCPGDLSVCFGCGEALQFDRRLRLTTITAAELAALHPEEREKLTATQGHIRRFLARE